MPTTLTVTPEMLDAMDQYLLSDLDSRQTLVRLLEMAEQQIDAFVPGPPIEVFYKNYRGETSRRLIVPKRIWYGSTEWHPEPQWLLQAYDQGKEADRDFALKDFGMGLATAIAFIGKRRDDYIAEHGMYDPETGATEFPDGGETVGEWDDIIEGLEGMLK